MPTYGENLRTARERAGLTQEEMAERMGITRQGNLPQYEADRKFPTPELVVQHAKALGLEPSVLLEGVETEYDRLRRPSIADTSAAAESSATWDPAQVQSLLRKYECDQADVAATRQALGNKIGEIGKSLSAQISEHLADLTALVGRLPRRQATVARRRGSGAAAHNRRRRGRHDQRRPPKTSPE